MIQYKIIMKDSNKNDTYESKFYIKPESDYIKVLEQFIEILKEHHLDIKPDSLNAIVISGLNPHEEYVILERVVDATRDY